MKRRDFLCCRSSGGQRLVTLSCQRLYMQYADSLSLSERMQTAADTDRPPENSEAWWSAEPALVVAPPSVDALFLAIGNELAGADVLVLQEREWLQDGGFSDRVKGLVARFRQHGGEVRYWIGESNMAEAG